jgi:hypothetical protein
VKLAEARDTERGDGGYGPRSQRDSRVIETRKRQRHLHGEEA